MRDYILKKILYLAERYEVDEYGNVYRIFKTTGRKQLKAFPHGAGKYLAVNLSRDDSHYPVKIHHLVALAYIGPPPTEIHQVHHINHDKYNNHVSNLCWVLPKENERAKWDAGRGVSTGTKLTQADYDYIVCERTTKKATLEELAKMFEVSITTIHNISRRKTNKENYFPNE